MTWKLVPQFLCLQDDSLFKNKKKRKNENKNKVDQFCKLTQFTIFGVIFIFLTFLTTVQTCSSMHQKQCSQLLVLAKYWQNDQLFTTCILSHKNHQWKSKNLRFQSHKIAKVDNSDDEGTPDGTIRTKLSEDFLIGSVGRRFYFSCGFGTIKSSKIWEFIDLPSNSRSIWKMINLNSRSQLQIKYFEI